MKHFNSSGARIWKKKGVIHRAKGPAVIYPNGGEEWWYEGQLHRVGAPAIIKPNATQWWVSGRLHRLDGPAWEDNGHKEWHVDGTLHRTDGPAIIYVDGKEEYYINGFFLSKEKFTIITTITSDKAKEKVSSLISI